MKKIIIIGLILILLFIAGCGKCTPRNLEETLLEELDNCDYKFGTDSSEKRQLSSAYCNRILDEIRKYKEQGLIEIQKEVILDKEIEEEVIPVQDKEQIDRAVDEIIGNI